MEGESGGAPIGIPHRLVLGKGGPSQVRMRRVIGLKKTQGGVRGIVVSDVFRQIIARTIAKQCAVAEKATAPFQYALRQTLTDLRTLPPASRQILAAAVSRGNPLRPRTPATAHADRWWPKTSRRRPHWQTRAVRGVGDANDGETIPSKPAVPNTRLTNGAEAKGPPWDFKRAMSGSDRVGNTTFKKNDSTARDATACHPTLGWFGSSSTGAGASTVDSDNSSQLGGVNPVATKLSTLLLMATMLGA